MKTGRQVPEPGVTPSPPWQFFEQQSAEVVQASASVLQPLPPGSGAHLFEVQTPVQQSLAVAVVQGSSSCLHASPEQVPLGAPTHSSE